MDGLWALGNEHPAEKRRSDTRPTAVSRAGALQGPGASRDHNADEAHRRKLVETSYASDLKLKCFIGESRQAGTGKQE
ncbi:hypothetical protein E2C01_046733 [Portunus trituberculatus]|uniref:Uncharacterized protein n=1 Tax=Portunus trituberculatus TaxID=210409 RepID=A0A5B7G8K0_PORTR|nr:hypothetical protein [Portunus trituberculatus]